MKEIDNIPKKVVEFWETFNGLIIATAVFAVIIIVAVKLS